MSQPAGHEAATAAIQPAVPVPEMGRIRSRQAAAEAHRGGPPGHHAGDDGGAAQEQAPFARDVERERVERLERASALLDQLLVALRAGVAHGQAAERPPGAMAACDEELGGDPAGDSAAGEAELAGWLRRLLEVPVGSVPYEQELARRMGPDWFGLRALPAAPPFLAGIDPATLRPAQVAPFLCRLSMTRPAPSRDELASAALDADPGPVTRVRRGAQARRWGQPPKAGAPLLPAETVIPHVVHGIWLGGPVPPDGRFARNFAAAARRYARQVDFVVWTDVPRRCLEEADSSAPRPSGQPDPLAPARLMLAWARRHGIHLISIHEVFHAGHPMLLHAQYTAEMAKQLPRGYCGASDHLRMEIIYQFGGAYSDGDNQFDADADGLPLTGTLPALFKEVAASLPGFTLHMLPEMFNGDVVIAPARHPAVRLLMELARVSYHLSQRQLFGGLAQMAQRHAGRASWLRWRRYTVAFRLGWVMTGTLRRLGFSPEAGLLVRAEKAISAGSELSWSRAEVPALPFPLTQEQVTARAAGAVATLARQMISREGDLHLTAVAPVIESLPDPGAAWIAVLALFAQLAEARLVPRVTSVTQFRWADDGRPEHVTLPPEAESLLDRAYAADGWLGADLAAPGQPAWLLDEAVTSARLRWPAAAPYTTAALREVTELITGPDGTITGIRLPARPAQAAGPAQAGGAARPLPMPPGYLAVHVEGHLGQPWAGHYPVPPEHLAVLLWNLGLAGRRVLLVNRARSAGGCPALHGYATRLAALLGQPVLPVDQAASPPEQAAPGTARPGRLPYLAEAGAPGSADGGDLASVASVLADAMAQARDLRGFVRAGRQAYRRASEQMAERHVLLLALDTPLAARLLADAQIMEEVAGPRRDAARRAAGGRVFGSYLLLARVAGPKLPGALLMMQVAAAAGAVAGLLAVNGALGGHDHATFVADWLARLDEDPRSQREIKAVRQRVARARRCAEKELPEPGDAGGDVQTAAGRVADRITEEMSAGCWPALANRVALLSGAARQMRAAAAVRLTAAAVAEGTGNAAQDGNQAAAELLGALAPDRCGTAGEPSVRRCLELSQVRRRELSAQLLERLRAATAAGMAAEPAAEAGGRPADAAETSQWLGRLVGLPAGTREYEDRIARRLGPDLFGLRRPAPPPPFLAAVDAGQLEPWQVAPFLRRLSMTHSPPTAGELAPEALNRDAGPVSRARRGARARRWGQPPKAGAPLLPTETVIPCVVHGIWLGGPVPVHGRFARNFADAARRFQGQADFALWTDVPRRSFDAARDGLPRPAGQPDPLAPVRWMLAWARRHGIHLISIPEVFQASDPMLLGAEYAAEMARQIPRGYAGASDLLRLDIVYRFGGAYADGDNLFGTDTHGRPLPGTLSGLFADVAASVPGFTLHVLPAGSGMNNDVVIAPARHPGIRLLCEAARIRYGGTEPAIFGGLLRMSQRHVGGRRVLLRYPLVHRTGRTHHIARRLLGFELDDARLVRADQVITYCSELSWAQPQPPPPLLPLTDDQVTACLARAAATLALQLIARPGNLHLPAVAPVIAALPEPDAAWVAILTLLAELAAAGTVPRVTSVTQFRFTDDGALEHIALPSEAEALLDRAHAAAGWLGADFAAPGQPAWLLDEAVTPARLRWPPPTPRRPAALRRVTRLIKDAGGSVTGIRVAVLSDASPPLPPGFLAVHVEARLGQVWVGQRPVTAEDLALLLCDLGLSSRPVVLVSQAHAVGGCPGLGPYAARLALLLSQPVLTVDAMAEPQRVTSGAALK